MQNDIIILLKFYQEKSPNLFNNLSLTFKHLQTTVTNHFSYCDYIFMYYIFA